MVRQFPPRYLARLLPRRAVLTRPEELRIGFVPWSPLGQGFLTGKVDPAMAFDPVSDLRATFPRFTREARIANWPAVDLLARIAAKKKATLAQIALAWLLAQKPFIVPIPGTRRRERLEEKLGAVEVHLTPDDLREIESGYSQITVHGARLSPEHMALIDPLSGAQWRTSERRAKEARSSRIDSSDSESRTSILALQRGSPKRSTS